jgi:hypothetical protein
MTTPRRTDDMLDVIVFSKDRPLQLDAALRSMRDTCRDPERLDIRVIAVASDDATALAYATLSRELPYATIVPERGFKPTLVESLRNSRHVLFVVDDTLFVRDWSAGDALDALNADPDALGVSLRLGLNTTYCYSLDAEQAAPPMTRASDAWVSYAWESAEHDFGYSLEVSTSIYRTSDLWPLIEQGNYTSPNSFEQMLASARPAAGRHRPRLLCAPISIAFCAPMNRVQETHQNRHSGREELSAAALRDLFVAGRRIDTDAMLGFVPLACHQEIDLPLR